MNLPRQPPEQKKYSWPSCVCRCGVFAELTVIPHTGSVTVLSLTAPRAVREQQSEWAMAGPVCYLLNGTLETGTP